MDGWMHGRRAPSDAVPPSRSVRRASTKPSFRPPTTPSRVSALSRATNKFKQKRPSKPRLARVKAGVSSSETRDARPIRSVPIRLVRTYDAPSVNQSNRGAFAACAHTSRPSTCEDGSVVSVGVVVVGVVGVARRFHQSFRRNKNARDRVGHRDRSLFPPRPDDF